MGHICLLTAVAIVQHSTPSPAPPACEEAEKSKVFACIEHSTRQACDSSAECMWCAVSSSSGQCRYEGSTCLYECDGSHFDRLVVDARHFHVGTCPTSGGACEYVAEDESGVVAIVIVVICYAALHMMCCRTRLQRVQEVPDPTRASAETMKQVVLEFANRGLTDPTSIPTLQRGQLPRRSKEVMI